MHFSDSVIASVRKLVDGALNDQYLDNVNLPINKVDFKEEVLKAFDAKSKGQSFEYSSPEVEKVAVAILNRLKTSQANISKAYVHDLIENVISRLGYVRPPEDGLVG